MKELQKEPFKVLHLLIGIVATMMILFTALVFKDSDTSFIGLEVAFGKEFVNLGPWASGKLTFNPIALIAFLLPFTAALSLIFTKQGYLASTVLFFLGAVLLYMIPEFTRVTVTVLGNTNQVDAEWSYGIGLILATSLSAIGGVLSAYGLYKKA